MNYNLQVWLVTVNKYQPLLMKLHNALHHGKRAANKGGRPV